MDYYNIIINNSVCFLLIGADCTIIRVARIEDNSYNSELIISLNRNH